MSLALFSPIWRTWDPTTGESAFPREATIQALAGLPPTAQAILAAALLGPATSLDLIRCYPDEGAPGAILIDMDNVPMPDLVPVERLCGLLFDLHPLTPTRWRAQIPNFQVASAPDRTCPACKQPTLTGNAQVGVYCTADECTFEVG